MTRRTIFSEDSISVSAYAPGKVEEAALPR